METHFQDAVYHGERLIKSLAASEAPHTETIQPGHRARPRTLRTRNFDAYFPCKHEYPLVPRSGSKPLPQSYPLNAHLRGTCALSYGVRWQQLPPSAHSLYGTLARARKTVAAATALHGRLRPRLGCRVGLNRRQKTFPQPVQPTHAATSYFSGYAMVVIKARAGCVVSSRVC